MDPKKNKYDISRHADAPMGMTSMFLSKMFDSGMLEHRRRTDSSWEQLQDSVYRDLKIVSSYQRR